MLLNINATRAFILCFYDIKSKRISHRHSCNVYLRSLCGSCPADMSPPPHDLERLRTTMVDFIVIFNRGCSAALNISTGPLSLRTFQTAGPVRASTLYLSLALPDHRVKCRASRLKITVARSMTNFATFSCILFLKFRYVCIA